MSIQLKRVAAVLFAAGVMSIPSISFAEATDQSDETKALRQEVAELRSEMKSVKSQMKKTHRAHHRKHRYVKHHEEVAANEQQTSFNQPPILPFDIDVPGHSFVSIGPYVSLPYSYTGTNLAINSPSVNTDVQLLNIRKSIINHLNERVGNITTDPHPHLLLSGIVEGQAIYENRDNQSDSDINLTNVSIDAILFGPSDWLLGFVELSYNSNPTPAGTFRVANSNVFVNKAFVTIGNFTKSPLYGTFGQFYVPFGTYSSVMVSDPFTKLLARTKARAALFGFQDCSDNAAYGSMYVFRGDTNPHNNRINNGGINLGYKFKTDMFKGDVGAGVIANIADSVGMQSSGFALSTSNEQLMHRVPAYDLRGTLGIGEHFDVIGEWITTARRFSTADMTFNGHGAEPWAVNLEGVYSFSMYDKPSSIGVGVGQSGQALALGLPETRYSAIFNTSLLKHTLQSLEFRRDHLYGKSETATVSGVPTASGNGIYDNVLTLQFDYYF